MSIHATTAAETEQNSAETHRIDVGPLADNCPTCGTILPTDTVQLEVIECPACRHVTEVSR